MNATSTFYLESVCEYAWGRQGDLLPCSLKKLRYEPFISITMLRKKEKHTMALLPSNMRTEMSPNKLAKCASKVHCLLSFSVQKYFP